MQGRFHQDKEQRKDQIAIITTKNKDSISFIAMISTVAAIAITKANVTIIGIQITAVCKTNLDCFTAFKILKNEGTVSYCFDSQLEKLIEVKWI